MVSTSMTCIFPLKSEAHANVAMNSGISTYKTKCYLLGVSIHVLVGAVSFLFPHTVSRYLDYLSTFKLSTDDSCPFVFT